MMLLTDLIDRYFLQHGDELSDPYRDQFAFLVSNMKRFFGTAPTTDHLRADLTEAYLQWLRLLGRKADTVRTRRTSIHTLWRFAWEEDLVASPPKLKRLRMPKRISPIAWTPREVEQFADTCLLLKGRFPKTGIERSWYMRSLALSMYSTGFRLGDMQCVSFSWISHDGSVRVVCSKTGREVVRWFSREALEAIERTEPRNRELIWPLWARRDRLFDLFRRVVRMANVRQGTSKYLRRAGVTQIAIRYGIEAAQRFADHRSPQTTRQHYIDESQLPTCRLFPELPPPARSGSSASELPPDQRSE